MQLKKCQRLLKKKQPIVPVSWKAADDFKSLQWAFSYFSETIQHRLWFYFILFYFILFRAGVATGNCLSTVDDTVSTTALIFILFYFILFYFILFYFILFYFILFYLILSYFILRRHRSLRNKFVTFILHIFHTTSQLSSEHGSGLHLTHLFCHNKIKRCRSIYLQLFLIIDIMALLPNL